MEAAPQEVDRRLVHQGHGSVRIRDDDSVTDGAHDRFKLSPRRVLRPPRRPCAVARRLDTPAGAVLSFDHPGPEQAGGHEEEQAQVVERRNEVRAPQRPGELDRQQDRGGEPGPDPPDPGEHGDERDGDEQANVAPDLDVGDQKQHPEPDRDGHGDRDGWKSRQEVSAPHPRQCDGVDRDPQLSPSGAVMTPASISTHGGGVPTRMTR
jgi:hypothetical protein